MSLLEDIINAPEEYGVSQSTSLSDDKLSSVNNAAQEKESRIFRPIKIESVADADTIQAMGEEKGIRLKGFDAYETYHGALDDSNPRYIKPDGTQDVELYHRDMRRLERQRHRYSEEFNVDYDLVTNEDVWEQGAKEGLKALYNVTKREGDEDWTPGDTSYYRNNELELGSKENPLNIQAAVEGHGRGKFDRELGTLYNTDIGYNVNAMGTTPHNVTRYDDGIFSKIKTEDAKARLLGYKGAPLEDLDPYELSKVRESGYGQKTNDDGRLVSDAKMALNSFGRGINNTLDFAVERSLSSLPKALDVFPEQVKKDAASFFDHGAKAETWDKLLDVNREHIEKANAEIARNVNNMFAEKADGFDIAKGVIGAITTGLQNPDLYIADNLFQTAMISRGKIPFAVGIMDATQVNINNYRKHNDGKDPSNKRLAAMIGMNLLLLGGERLIMRGPLRETFDNLKGIAGSTMKMTAGEARQHAAEVARGMKSGVGKELMLDIAKGSAKAGGSGIFEMFQEGGQQTSDKFLTEGKIIGGKELAQASLTGLGVGTSARGVGETVIAANKLKQNVSVANELRNSLKGARSVGKEASATTVESANAQATQQQDQQKFEASRLEEIHDTIHNEKELTNDQKNDPLFQQVMTATEDKFGEEVDINTNKKANKFILKKLNEKIINKNKQIGENEVTQESMNEEFNKRKENRKQHEDFTIDENVDFVNKIFTGETKATLDDDSHITKALKWLDGKKESGGLVKAGMQMLQSYNSRELQDMKNNKDISTVASKVIDRVLANRNKINERANTEMTENAVIDKSKPLNDQGGIPITSSAMNDFITAGLRKKKITSIAESQSLHDAINISEENGIISSEQADKFKTRIDSKSRNASESSTVSSTPTEFITKEQFDNGQRKQAKDNLESLQNEISGLDQNVEPTDEIRQRMQSVQEEVAASNKINKLYEDDSRYAYKYDNQGGSNKSTTTESQSTESTTEPTPAEKTTSTPESTTDTTEAAPTKETTIEEEAAPKGTAETTTKTTPAEDTTTESTTEPAETTEKETTPKTTEYNGYTLTAVRKTYADGYEYEIRKKDSDKLIGIGSNINIAKGHVDLEVKLEADNAIEPTSTEEEASKEKTASKQTEKTKKSSNNTEPTKADEAQATKDVENMNKNAPEGTLAEEQEVIPYEETFESAPTKDTGKLDALVNLLNCGD